MSEIKNYNLVYHVIDNQQKYSEKSYNNNTVKFSYHLNNESNNNTKNKKSANKNKNRGKKLKINSISQLEYIYNDSQEKTTSTNQNRKIKKKNMINFTSNERNSTDVVTTNNNRGDNHSRQNYQKKLKKNHRSQMSFDNFWKNVKDKEKNKITKINKLRKERLNEEISEMRSFPKISKRSIYLANNKERDALYLNRPLSEEKILENDFLKFYKINLDKTNKEKQSKIDEKKTQEKFNRFYTDNMIWKNNKDKINNRIRIYKNKISEENIKVYTFRPLLSKKTEEIIKKKKAMKKIDLSQYNNLYNNGSEREILDKIRLKLKPVLSEMFDINNTKRPFISKKSYYLADNLIDNNRKKKLYKENSYQIIPSKRIYPQKKRIKATSKEEYKDNNIYAEDFNKYKFKKNRKKMQYEYYLLQKFREINNPKVNKKKELYKLNIRQSTAWNQEFVNNIIPKRKCGYIIEGLL